jgi:hypothetical protein
MTPARMIGRAMHKATLRPNAMSLTPTAYSWDEEEYGCSGFSATGEDELDG